MYMSEEITQYDPNEVEEAEVTPELELPPVVTRTRSGRRVRTPAALLDSEVPSLVKTPSRRTRKSAIQKLPENKTGNQNTEPNTTIPAVKQMIESPTMVKSDGVSNDACNEKENDARTILMELAIRPQIKTAKRTNHSESSEKRNSSIPLGKPKSGRVWKDRNKQRFSALLRDKPLRSSWEKKMEAKRGKEMVKKYSLQLKEDKAREKEDKRKRREDNLKRRAENERKAEVVQVIRNTSKIKRMKKKQLRKIEKRDTLAMLQKSKPKTPKAPEKVISKY
ncbi:coiled-coil domain-containing protein 86 [Osmerus eperlanus]|uniref:coiled-coil domain-containing protein 86 n=1 Tax=Osmerus eperlanus TaxID=29151 RepID=UPI002E154B30